MRGKPRKTITPIHKKISFPQDVVVELDLLLYSEVDGRVPHGAWSQLLEGLLREYLDKVKQQRRLTHG